jgi:hypothetical protein
MTLKSSYHQLSDMNKQISTQWRQLKEIWQDQNAHEFEQQFMRPLEIHLRSSLGAIAELDEIFSSIQEDFKS